MENREEMLRSVKVEAKGFLRKIGFAKFEHLGAGSFGVVLRGLHVKSNELRAIKCMLFSNKMLNATDIREISLLYCNKHPNIISLYNIYKNNNKLYLIFEYCCLDLYKYISLLKVNSIKKNRIRIKMIIFQLIESLRYIHSKRLIHRDLKPANILVDRNHNIKLCDFGLGKEIDLLNNKELSLEVVTLWYRSPEILYGIKKYNDKCDIWSLGCIIYELLTYHVLFKGKSEANQIHTIFKKLGNKEMLNCDYYEIKNLIIYQGYNEFDSDIMMGYLSKKNIDHCYAMDLLIKILNIDYNKRPNALEIIQHYWFDEVRQFALDGYKTFECKNFFNIKPDLRNAINNPDPYTFKNIIKDKDIYFDPTKTKNYVIITPQTNHDDYCTFDADLLFDDETETKTCDATNINDDLTYSMMKQLKDSLNFTVKK